MSNNYRRTDRQKRDLESLKNIQRLPRRPHSDNGKPKYGPRNDQRVADSRPKKRKVRQKKKAKLYIGRILFFIILMIGAIYLVSIVIETAQKPVVSYQMVQRGMIDNSDVFNGLLVRSEKVVPNTEEGNMYLIAAEGEKVRKNGQIYQVLDRSQTMELEEDIQKVESNIEKVQHKRQGISYYQSEIKTINNNIDNHVNEFYTLSKPGELHKTHELRKQVEYEIGKRKNIHMQDQTTGLKALKDEKEDLSAKLNANQKIYRAGESGVISYYIDGFEDIFTPETIDKITEKDIKKKYSNQETTANQTIEANKPAYKIIDDEQWYMVCFMPEDWAQRFEEGKQYDFVMMEDNHEEFTLKVEKNEPQEKKHRVVFSSREQLTLISTKRTLAFKSTQYIHEGLKVPKTAIVERNFMKIPSQYIVDAEDGKGVLKVVGVDHVFSPIEIQYEDEEGFTYLLQDLANPKTLQLGDVVVNPAQITDIYSISQVSTTQGVYVVNGRITKFKQLHSLAENDEYIIANSKGVNGLKQFDQIITNPKSVLEEQLLKDMDIKNIKK